MFCQIDKLNRPDAINIHQWGQKFVLYTHLSHFLWTFYFSYYSRNVVVQRFFANSNSLTPIKTFLIKCILLKNKLYRVIPIEQRSSDTFLLLKYFNRSRMCLISLYASSDVVYFSVSFTASQIYRPALKIYYNSNERI